MLHTSVSSAAVSQSLLKSKSFRGDVVAKQTKNSKIVNVVFVTAYILFGSINGTIRQITIGPRVRTQESVLDVNSLFLLRKNINIS